MENSNWLFDEFFEVVYPKDSNFQMIKPMIQDSIFGELIPEDFYELFYYYAIRPTMIYVNNYYDYNVYDPKVYKRNMEKAVDNYSHTMEERAVNMAREIAIKLTEFTEEHTIYTTDGRIMIKYIWKCEPGACKICKKLEGKKLTDSPKFKTHWNCRCRLEQHIYTVDSKNRIIKDDTKII